HGLGPPVRVEGEWGFEDGHADVAGDPDGRGRVIERRGLADVGDAQRATASRGLPVDRGAEENGGQDQEDAHENAASAQSHRSSLPGRGVAGQATPVRFLASSWMSDCLTPRPWLPPKYSPAPPEALCRELGRGRRAVQPRTTSLRPILVEGSRAHDLI